MASRADQILHAAARLFAERGYGATGIDDIGAAVGVSGPAIYWHFPGKQALLAAMLTDVSERLLAGGRECVAQAADPAAALDALVRMQVEFALEEPDLIVVHARELHHLDTEQAHRVRSLQRQYVDVWVDAMQQANPRVKRPRLVAAVQAAIGLVNSTPYVSRLPRKSLEPLLHDMAIAALAAV
ncbi:MAG: TetR/AcrR family transcriptional regulator [Actinomycetota bacterium]|nr:TetR/AcrR family transcriptional regulator [Actinomycetota bacterium]